MKKNKRKNFRIMKGAKRKTSVSENKPLFNTKNALFYSQFWNENGQNVKCVCSFIPHSYSGMDRTFVSFFFF